MSGPFVRMIVQLAVASASVFSRAFVEAYQQAIQSKCPTMLKEAGTRRPPLHSLTIWYRYGSLIRMAIG